MSKDSYNKPLEKIQIPITGNLYHISWANPGCIWKCVEINMKTGWVKLKTPSTGKEIHAKIESLRKPRR